MSLSGELGPRMNKFEQVSSDDHQMSLAEGVLYLTFPRGTLPRDLSHDAFDIPLDGQTDPCGNITSRNFIHGR